MAKRRFSATLLQSTKVCAACKVEKPDTAFYRRGGTDGGLRSVCIACHSATVQRRRRANRPVHAAQAKRWCETNPRGAFNASLRNRHGIGVDAYEAMLAAQQGVCAICREPETKIIRGRLVRLSVDHDHACCPGNKSCGRCVRGLLCSRCNSAIGLLDESCESLKRAVAYLCRRPDGEA